MQDCTACFAIAFPFPEEKKMDQGIKMQICHNLTAQPKWTDQDSKRHASSANHIFPPFPQDSPSLLPGAPLLIFHAQALQLRLGRSMGDAPRIYKEMKGERNAREKKKGNYLKKQCRLAQAGVAVVVGLSVCELPMRNS